MPPIRQSQRNIAKSSRVVNSTIEILNDDCLLEIFKHLTPMDICALKDCSRRFRTLAIVHMASVYRSKEFVLNNDTIIARQNNNQLKLFFKFCEIFEMLSLSVSSNDWLQKHELNVLSKIQKCNPKLIALTLTSNNFDLALSRLTKIFPNLQKIKLQYLDKFECDIRREEVITSIYKRCRNVEDMWFGAYQSAMGGQYQGIFLQQKFKKLRSLVLYEVRNLDLNNLNLFLRYNPNLKSITITRCISVAELEDIDFVHNAPNINGISFHFGVNDFRPGFTFPSIIDYLWKLENLQYFSFDTCATEIVFIMNKLAQRNTLKYLSLTKVCTKYNEGLAEAIGRMTNLQILRLDMNNYIWNPDFCEQLSINNLVNLVDLHFRGYELQFKDLRHIVENAANLKRLYLPRMYEVYNELNLLELAHARLRKAGRCQLNIFILKNEYSLAMGFIPEEILNENHHIIKLAEYSDLDFDYCWIPNSL